MRSFPHGRVTAVLGDLVEQETDAIVNAANTRLLGGGGVDGALHRAAGPALRRACEQLPADEQGRRCRTGDVKTTAAGELPARYVIHAVGPVYDADQSERAETLLRQVHQRALEAARQHGCQSVGFPAISTGAYRFPTERAAAIATDVACRAMQQADGLQEIRFVLFNQAQYDGFTQALQDWNAAG